MVLQFPSPWVTHPVGVGFGFIDGAAPLPLSCCGFFVFGRGVSVFFGEFQCPPVDGCSTVSCCFGAFAGGDDLMPLSLNLRNFRGEITMLN